MTERRAHLDTLAVACLVGCCFVWGLNQVAAKVALPEVPALQQAALRSLGGALLVWTWAQGRGISLFDNDGTLPGGLLAGLLFAAEFGCIFLGLQFTSASRMVVFIYLSPFVVALGMPFIAKSERLSLAALVSGTPLPLHLSTIAWASLGFQVVIVTFASYLLWFWLMRQYPATRIASFTLLTPVFGLLMGGFLLGEPITLRLQVALVAVALGIVLVNRKAR